MRLVNMAATEQVQAITAETRSQSDALRTHFNKIEKQIQDFLAGSTPADAIDMKGFRKFLAGGSDAPAAPAI